jgi:putative transposase
MHLLMLADHDAFVTPPSPSTLSLPPPLADLSQQTPPKDWPHAPVHRLTGHGVFIVTAGTLHKRLLFDTPAKRDLVERVLLSYAKHFGWQLEAWAVFANHYHFVGRDTPGAAELRTFVSRLHSESARQLNRIEGTEGRTVWHQFWDTRLTYQHAYLARLNYVHQNPVRHGLVRVANQYPWCSAAWFERIASPAQVKTVYGMKIDRVKVEDGF